MLSESTEGVILPIRVKPRASHTRIAGERGGRLLIEVTAPPVDRKANYAACRLIAKSLGIATGRVTIAGGERSRDKLLHIAAMPAEAVAHKLGLEEPG